MVMLLALGCASKNPVPTPEPQTFDRRACLEELASYLSSDAWKGRGVGRPGLD